jgi:hypothetical protein
MSISYSGYGLKKSPGGWAMTRKISSRYIVQPADHDPWHLPIDEPIPDLIAAEYRVGSVVIWVLIEGIPHKVH